MTPLFIAAHGTRDPEGVAACEALVDRIRGQLPDTPVAVGYVELTPPPIEEALLDLLTGGQGAGASGCRSEGHAGREGTGRAEGEGTGHSEGGGQSSGQGTGRAGGGSGGQSSGESEGTGHSEGGGQSSGQGTGRAGGGSGGQSSGESEGTGHSEGGGRSEGQGPQVPHAAVVPLMLNTGTHVRHDIPAAIAAVEAQLPGAYIDYARPLGDDPRLLAAVQQRIADAVAQLPEESDPRDVTVVLVGRGAAVPEANADHARLARILYERGRHAQVLPAYVQVARPGLPEALGQAVALGAKAIVVAPYVLLPGMLRTWCREQVGGWTQRHPDVPLAMAEVIGDCDELAAVVVERYREVALDAAPEPGSPTYLAGLRLADREVLVVGAGRVADRRVPRLVEVGARVRLVSPTLSIRLRRYVREGLLTWEQRGYRSGDIGAAWYVLACTNDPEVNAAVAAEAEAAHTYCVRADAAREGSAWTPATTSAAGLTVAVLGRRDPRRSASVRDALLRVLHG